MAGLSVKTPATDKAITRQELIDHLRIDDQAENDVLDSVIDAATTYAEEITGRAFTQKTYLYTLDRFLNVIALPRPPVVSISSIKYIDTNGALQTLAGANYQLDNQGFAHSVLPAYGESWPSIRVGDVNPVRIEYIAGYDVADVPAPIKQAVKMIAADMWTNREDSAPISLVPVPYAARCLLAPYKLNEFGW